MADKKQGEKKKKLIGLNFDTVFSKMQSIGKVISNPFRTTNPRFSEEESESYKSMDASPPSPVKKSGSLDKSKTRSMRQPKAEAPKSETKPLILPVRANPPSHIMKTKNSPGPLVKTRKIEGPRRRAKKINEENQKLRDEVADLTNELGRLGTYDESNELKASVSLAAEEVRITDEIFKGARHAVRSQFKQIADEVQADKENIWSQMMTLEALVGREAEEQMRLGKDLDSIIEILQRMEEQKGAKEKNFCTPVLIIVIAGLLVAVLAILIYIFFKR